MSKLDRTAVRIVVDKDLALQAQDLLRQQGVPLNVTQSVKALLTIGIQTKQAALSAKVFNNDCVKQEQNN
jgi:hypothetical protein